MPRQLITLEPMSPFFFGGEHTFGENNRDYYVVSNKMPQQTTLLGMLRYQLLKQNNLLGTPKSGWIKYIGNDSFQENGGVYTPSFGYISNLSPLFITNGQKHFIPQSLDWAYFEDAKSEKAIAAILFEKEEGNPPMAKVGGTAFNPKHGLATLWVESSGKELHQSKYEKDFTPTKVWTANTSNAEQIQNGFYIEVEKVGIHKSVDKWHNSNASTSKNKAFYRQVSYKLIPGYKFSFMVDCDQKINDDFVKIGGEGAVFKMHSTIIGTAGKDFKDIFNEKTFSHFHGKRAAACIVLTSDAHLVGQDLNDLMQYGIYDYVPFRNIVTISSANSDEYHTIGKGISKIKNKKHLLKRGSVFYPKNVIQFQQLLKAETAFTNIGYNHFQII